MELALNLLWLCVAIAGIVLQCLVVSRAAASTDQPPNNWRKVVAMGCALVILFFVISMTDDLHDQEVMVEESKSLRIVSGTGTLLLSAPGRVAPTVFLLLRVLACSAPALPAVRRFIEPSELLFAVAIDCDRLCGRAPPASLA
jgi:hypothetical protein